MERDQLVQWQMTKEEGSALEKLSITLRFPAVVSTAQKGETHGRGAGGKEVLHPASSKELCWGVSQFGRRWTRGLRRAGVTGAGGDGVTGGVMRRGRGKPAPEGRPAETARRSVGGVSPPCQVAAGEGKEQEAAGAALSPAQPRSADLPLFSCSLVG